MKRRDFLKISGGIAASSLAFGACSRQTTRQIAPLLIQDEELISIPKEESWLPALCFQCLGGCGLLVRLVEGKAKKIEGNPLYPVNFGKSCAWGQASLQTLYNPDRVKTPLLRTGSTGSRLKGSGQFQPISWDEGLSLLVEKLSEIRAQRQPQTFLFLTGHLRGHKKLLVERFMEAFGSPNLFHYQLFSDEPVRKANLATMGYDAFAGFDLERTSYLLSFGANFLNGYRSPVYFASGFGQMRQGRPGFRAKVVQVESRFSLTAANADEWIPINPATEAALALGIAHVIIKEALYDEEFVHNFTSDFQAFQKAVLKEYPPEQVSKITGVSKQTIERLAREFARFTPSLAIGGDATTAHTNALFALIAINALNALVGSIGKEGGLFFPPPPPFAPLDNVSKDEIAARGMEAPPLDLDQEKKETKVPLNSSRIALLAKRHRDGKPYPIRVGLIYQANPIFSIPQSFHFREAMEKIPFLVSFSPFLDETTELADLVLPDLTPLESWMEDVPEGGLSFSSCGVSKPIVRPMYNGRSSMDMLIEVDHRLGLNAFDWESFEAFLKSSYEGLYKYSKARKGSVVADSEEDFESFWKQLLEKGGWWDDKSWGKPVFQTPTKKFEFIPKQLGSQPNGMSILYEPPRFSEGDKYPYHLYIFQSSALADGRLANLPWLQEMPDPMTGISWNSWVEINPKTAEQLEIKDGDLVLVESPYAKLRLPAVLYPGAMPDVVNVPVGQGHTAHGRYARGRGENPLQLLAPQTVSIVGSVAWASTKVRISKTGEKMRLAREGYAELTTKEKQKLH